MSNTTHFIKPSRKEKLGIALSGGGFRAALFHIGVLARLAELDLLCRLEVISTVSGGSIIGTYYYLKVKELLEGKRKDKLKPSPEAAIQIVQEIEIDFLKAVQKNVRVRTFLDPLKNAKMMREDYSNTERVAELYTQYFYGPVWQSIDPTPDDPTILLKDIRIQPAPHQVPPHLQKMAQLDLSEYNQHADFKGSDASLQII